MGPFKVHISRNVFLSFYILVYAFCVVLLVRNTLILRFLPLYRTSHECRDSLLPLNYSRINAPILPKAQLRDL